MKKSSTLPILLAASIILSLMGCSAPSSDASEAEGELQLSEVAPEEKPAKQKKLLQLKVKKPQIQAHRKAETPSLKQQSP